MTEYALRLENSTDTATRMRFGDALGLVHDGTPVGGRSGLRHAPTAGAVTVVDGSMSVEVQPFLAWIDGTVSTAQAGYPFVSDAAKTLTLADGDATLDRVDTVVAQVQDNAYDASGATLAQVTVLQGAPGSGAPALPDNTIALQDVNVPAGTSVGTGGLTSSNLGADRRTYLAALGGVVPVASVTDRDGLGAAEGQLVYRMDTGTVQKYDGAGWTTLQEVDDTGWQAPSYQNGWTARDGSPAYRRVGGVVYLRGRVQNTAYTSGPAFTLPTGYRPATTLYMSAPAGNGYGRVQVDSTGAVTFDTNGANSNFQSIAGANFPTG